MEYKTFDEWSSLGYLIVKGGKAKKINTKNVFSKTQVKLKTQLSYYSGTSMDLTIEEDAEYCDYFGIGICGN